MGIARNLAVGAAERMVGLRPADEFNLRVEYANELNMADVAPLSRVALFSAVVAGPQALEEYTVQRQRYEIVSRAAEQHQFVVHGKHNINPNSDHDHNDTMLQVIIPISGIRYSAYLYDHREEPFIVAKAAVPTFNASMGDRSNRLAHAKTHISVGRRESRFVDEAVAKFLKGGEINEGALRIEGSPIDSGSAWFETSIQLADKNGSQVIEVIGEQRIDPLHGIVALQELAEAAGTIQRTRVDQLRILGVVAKALEQARTGEPYITGESLMSDSKTKTRGFEQFRGIGNISMAVTSDLKRFSEIAKKITPRTPRQHYDALLAL